MPFQTPNSDAQHAVWPMWSCLVSLLGMTIGFAGTVTAQNTALRPSIVEIDSKLKATSINIYDIFVLGDGRELYAHPKWSRNVKRPADIRSMTSIMYSPYDRTKGGIGYPPNKIQKVIYWEELATQAVLARMKKNDYGGADKIVTALEKFNPNWKTTAPLRARIEVRRSFHKIESLGKTDEGLNDLESLHKQFPRDGHVEERFVGLLISLAEKSLRAEDVDQSLGYLNRAQRVFPSNENLVATTRRWRTESAELLTTAEKTQQSDASGAIEKAELAIRMSPDADLRRRARIVIRNAEGLILASYETAAAFEPFNATRPVERQIVHLMHDFLMQRDETGTRYGRTGMVARVQPRDLNQQYLVDLQPGMRFSDGSPITAADVVSTIELLRNENGEAFDAEWERFITGARQASPFSVEIDVNPHPRPDSLLYLPVLSRKAFPEMPKRGDKKSFSPSAVSGPYRMSTIHRDDIQLVANREYRLPLQIGKIKFKRYVKRGTGHAINDLLQGRIHTITDPSPAQIQRIRNTPAKFETRRIEPNSVWVLAVNHGRSLFGGKLNPNGQVGARDLRRAASLAIDRQGILNQYFNVGGRAQLSHAVISGPFPRQSKAYDLTVPVPTAETDAAKSLVKRYSAFVNQRKLVLKYADHGDVVEASLAQIKRDLEAVGFGVDLQKRPNNAFLRELRNGSFDLAYYRIEHDNVLFNIANLFDSAPQKLGVGSNFMSYNDQKLSQMFEDLRTTKSSDEIWAIQNKIHRFVATEAVVIPLWQLDTYIAYTRRLVGRTESGESQLPID